MNTHLDVNLSLSQIAAHPGSCLPFLGKQIRSSRWFAEKDAHIESIHVADSFPLASEDGRMVEGNMARFRLKDVDGGCTLKHYFIPLVFSEEHMEDIPEDQQFVIRLSDGKCRIAFAEHSPLFQKAILRHYGKSGIIRTSKQGTVCFRASGKRLADIDEDKINARAASMNFSSSNVLTFIETDREALINKVYKDMRGVCGKDEMWLPNPEALRYEALAAADYPQIPRLHGTVFYRSPTEEETPLCMIMEALPSRGQVGEVFGKALARFTESLKKLPPNEYLRQYGEHIRGLGSFAAEVAKRIARMHTAFLNSGKPGFQAEAASVDDISRWCDTMGEHFEAALAALKSRNRNLPQAKALSRLTDGLVRSESHVRKNIASLHGLEGVLMKAQVHGDMHGDQGLIRQKDPSEKLEHEFATQQEASLLAADIRWLDFEGPPAKIRVPADYDSRENPLTDLAGMIQAFCYMANIRLYEHLGLNHENPQDHEKQRKASLLLAGYGNAEAADISESEKAVIQVLKRWQKDMAHAFSEGYFDEMERQNAQGAVLKKWDRDTARRLIRDWVLARAFHELRYETSARNWGWEGIPGSRIMQMLRFW